MNQLGLPVWFNVILFLLIFDLAIYLQHRLFHFVPWFWRLYRMHHTDMDYDLTTGIRFHPASILISTLIKIGLVISLGALPGAIVAAEILLNATSMSNQSNNNISASIDRVPRQFIVTPDMHRVHHSTNEIEHNNNFGFNFPCWDRVFGTYQAQPQQNHSDMEIGITGFRNSGSSSFFGLLSQPLRRA